MFAIVVGVLHEYCCVIDRFFSTSGSESQERIGVLSIEESGESQSAAVSLPAPAVRNLTTSTDNVLRPALVRRPFAPRREDRHLGALDSAEDAEETENRVAAASVKNRDPAIDQSRRTVLHGGRRSSPGAISVPAFEPTFVRPAPRRRRVRIAEQTHVAPSTPLPPEVAFADSSRSSRARGGSGSHGGLHKDAIEAFQEHLAAELGAAAAAAEAENVGETDSN